MIVIIRWSSSQNDYYLSHRSGIVLSVVNLKMMVVVTRCLTTQDTEFYQEGIDKLFP